MARATKVPVSERAVLARINRKLAKSGEQIRKCRADSGPHATLGDYYCVNTKGNFVVYGDAELDRIGRLLGVLRPFEELAV